NPRVSASHFRVPIPFQPPVACENWGRLSFPACPCFWPCPGAERGSQSRVAAPKGRDREATPKAPLTARLGALKCTPPPRHFPPRKPAPFSTPGTPRHFPPREPTFEPNQPRGIKGDQGV